jgi:uncharacterized membrane protein YdjX (TVP38/TMEM64 family)
MKDLVVWICKLVIGITGVFTVFAMMTPWNNILEKVVQVAGFVVISVMMLYIADEVQKS